MQHSQLHSIKTFSVLHAARTFHQHKHDCKYESVQVFIYRLSITHTSFTRTSGAFVVTCTSTQQYMSVDNLQWKWTEWMLCEKTEYSTRSLIMLLIMHPNIEQLGNDIIYDVRYISCPAGPTQIKLIQILCCSLHASWIKTRTAQKLLVRVKLTGNCCQWNRCKLKVFLGTRIPIVGLAHVHVNAPLDRVHAEQWKWFSTTFQDHFPCLYKTV